jgi:hypothetical protein
VPDSAKSDLPHVDGTLLKHSLRHGCPRSLAFLTPLLVPVKTQQAALQRELL